MNTLTLIELSDAAWCELNDQTLRALRRADVVICDAKQHQPYLKYLSTKCSTVNAAVQTITLKSLTAQVLDEHDHALRIVCLWNTNGWCAELKTLIDGPLGYRALKIAQRHQLKPSTPRLARLPLFLENGSPAPRLFVTQQDWETHLEPSVPADCSYPNHIVYAGVNVPLSTLAMQALKLGLPSTSAITLISTESPIVIRKSTLHQATRQGSEVVNAKDLVIIGRPPDHDTLEAWCAQRPLLGRRFMITRAFEQQQPLSERLSHLGAQNVCLAVNGFAAISSDSQQRMYRELNRYDWIILTSVNAVHFFLKGLEQHGGRITDLDTIKIACVGPVTTAAVKSMGLNVALEPAAFTSEGLLKAFAQTAVKGSRMLLPRARVARPVLPDSLRMLQAHVDVVATYETRRIAGDPKLWKQMNALALDGVLFCASSAACDLESWIDTAEEASFKGNVPAFCIGPSTRVTAIKMGYAHVATATEHTVPGLVDCVAQYYLTPS